MIGSVSAVAAGSSGCHIFSGCGFPSPSLESFDFKPIFSIGSFHFTKPILIVIICAVLVIAFFWAAFAKPKLVPRGMQNLGELGLLAVRDQIVRPSLGKRGDTYLPFLTSMFFFIYFCNLMEVIPFFQFPPMSRSGFPWSLVLIVYLTYLYMGFKTQGAWGYIRNMIPSDVPIFVLVILIPIELLRYFVIQPFTLGVRLFANMFAGHLLLLIFTLATWYLASASIGLLFAATSAIMVLAVFLLELLVQLLQAFIFTTLAATYIADSLEGSH
ncbi:MAG TPA: F0F1 ATP synthase subunit A [Streptosporangiaceae bacterium]